MNEKSLVDLERLFADVSRLQSDLEQISRDSGEWKTWTKEFEDVLRSILNNKKSLSGAIDEMNDALKKNNPNAPVDPSAPMSKEEKAKMSKQLQELTVLFEISESMTRNAVETGALKPEEARGFLVDFIGRIMSSLPDDNEYKKALRHLKARVEMGDEIKSILDTAKKVRPTKMTKAEAPQVKADGINISPETLTNGKALMAGLLGAAVAASAPKIAQKVGETGMFANIATMLSDALSNAAGGAEQVESVEEEDEVEVEAEVSDDVVIAI